MKTKISRLILTVDVEPVSGESTEVGVGSELRMAWCLGAHTGTCLAENIPSTHAGQLHLQGIQCPLLDSCSHLQLCERAYTMYEHACMCVYVKGILLKQLNFEKSRDVGQCIAFA